ncbi:MAG: carboxypeptidase regulatory-like domain-containing protein, partial [Planctomycetes bacterium]|nr:carboxypeptidase regulatory-like domain-containing protein [Planctomycetota bacterium]
MTVRDAAGALIDFTSSVSTDDQLAAFFPGKKQFAYRSVMFRDGSGKEVAPTAEGIVSQAASIVVKAEATETLPEVSVTYSLRAADPYLTVTSTFTNRSSKPLTVSLEDDFRADGGREEMVRSPNATTDRFWLYDRYWGQAYGLDAAGLKMQLNSDPRVTAIKYETPSGQSNVTLEPGQSHQLVRHLYSSSDVFRIHQLSQLNIKQKQDFADVTIGCQDLKGSRNNYWLEFMKGDDVVGSLRLQQTDSFRIPLIPGDYGIRLYYCGNSTGTISQLTVPASGASVTLQSHLKTGVVQGRVLDEHGERIPCKVELKPLTPDAKLDFGPESAEFAVRNLIYTPDGRFERDLPAGKYSVTVSRGPEFDAIFSEIDVVADQTATISGKLIRTVNTSGWISTDYHSHSTPSGDNTSSQLGRVLNLVAENI